MSKYFKNVQNYNELKKIYKELLKTNHPDNGGDLAKMQEINAEYDVMFKIWKDRAAKDNTLNEEKRQKQPKVHVAIFILPLAGKVTTTVGAEVSKKLLKSLGHM